MKYNVRLEYNTEAKGIVLPFTATKLIIYNNTQFSVMIREGANNLPTNENYDYYIRENSYTVIPINGYLFGAVFDLTNIPSNTSGDCTLVFTTDNISTQDSLKKEKYNLTCGDYIPIHLGFEPSMMVILNNSTCDLYINEGNSSKPDINSYDYLVVANSYLNIPVNSYDYGLWLNGSSNLKCTVIFISDFCSNISSFDSVNVVPPITGDYYCYNWNLLINDGGFTRLVGNYGGTWFTGLGWRSTVANGLVQCNIEYYFNFVSNLTEINVIGLVKNNIYVCGIYAINEDLSYTLLQSQNFGQNNVLDTPVNQTWSDLYVGAIGIAIQWVKTGNIDYAYVENVAVKGEGSNPVDVNNCVY